MSQKHENQNVKEAAAVHKSSSVSKKNIVLFSVLGAVLVLLIVGTILAFKLIKDPEEESKFDIWDGESAVGNAAHLAYPMIDDQNDVTRVEIKNENGNYSFAKIWDDRQGYVWRMLECKDIEINKSSFEMLRMHVSMALTKNPMRNVSEQDMIDWGVDSSCKNGYTVYYMDGNVEKSYTVRIGKQANDAAGSYCAYIEGRNHIYKFGKDACAYVLMSRESYLSPTISTFFANETYALLGIDKFEMFLAKDSSLSSLVTINVDERDESAVNFKAVYSEKAIGKKRTTVASTSYLTNVFSTLYVNFAGSEVVVLAPNEEDLEKYGLGAHDEKYLLDVKFADSATFASPELKNKEPELFISKKIDGYYYVLSQYQQKDLIVKVSEDTLSFLGEDAYSLIKWTDVTSITTGFFESLCKNTETNTPGLDKIVIKSYKDEDNKTFNEETFNLYYDENEDILLVKAENRPELEFLDNKNPENSYDKNWFRNLYVYFLYYPFIHNFNTMTSEEMSLYEKEENIAYSITAYRADGKVVRYTYYKIDVNLAFEKAEVGTLLGEGHVEFGEPTYDYTCSMTYIRKLNKAIDLLLSGERVTPDDELL